MTKTAFTDGPGRRQQETVMVNLTQLSPHAVSALFAQTLLENMREGVIFLDTQCRITTWNFCMEQTTGIGNSIIGRRFTPGLLQLRDLQGHPIDDTNCPIQRWMAAREPMVDRFQITGRSGRETQVEMHFHPVSTSDGQLLGATVLVVDTSVQIELQRQLNDLYAIAVLDPLTQVANRAEFERILDDYVRTHLAVGLTCSIIIADLDFFKQINDNFGHHVGDLALVAFAQLIKQFVRSHDFIARYGGEEFVILCANCDELAALQRAEEIRSTLASVKQSVLNGKCMTASFGVSELMSSDDATSLFVRADHALLKAKETGRNRVVSASAIASGTIGDPEPEVTSASGITWRPLPREALICEEYASKTPLVMLMQKVRGFIEESNAEILKIEDRFMAFRLTLSDPKRPSRPIGFIVEVDIETADKAPEKTRATHRNAEVYLRVSVDQVRSRWSKEVHPELAQKILNSFLALTMLIDPTCHIQAPEMATQAKSRYQ